MWARPTRISKLVFPHALHAVPEMFPMVIYAGCSRRVRLGRGLLQRNLNANHLKVENCLKPLLLLKGQLCLLLPKLVFSSSLGVHRWKSKQSRALSLQSLPGAFSDCRFRLGHGPEAVARSSSPVCPASTSADRAASLALRLSWPGRTLVDQMACCPG